ncbi:hypothetical protein ABKV19_014037 [Rosa sericea]
MADALISVLLEQLASVVYKHTNAAVKLVLDAEKDVKSFSSKLKAIQAVLEDAEKKQVTEASVGDWLKKLKDVSYEMDDVLDEWNTELLRQQVEEKQEVEGDNALVTKKKVCFPMPSGCFCFGQVNKVIHHHNIAKRIKELNERLTLIAAEREMYGFHQSTIGGHDEQLIQRQKTSSLVDISMIFGREEEKEMLLSKLLRESNQDGGKLLVIPIVGMGGMGKTTLAQLAYNHEKVTAHFDKKVWVCVSDPFDEIKIAKAIIESLVGTPNSSNELETLLQCIKTHIKNKKLLLVLDDVWTEDETKWENLKLPIIMQSCEEGSSILDCLALFNSIAFLDREEDEADELGDIGKKIVKRCKGLPLAVKTLGSLLWYKKTRKEWEDVLKSEIWELEKVEQHVFRPLLLSYYDLAPARRVGQYCFESLSMRSFFQDFRKDEVGNVYGCKMHDIVHDFLQFLSQNECVIIEAVEGANQSTELPGDKVCHLTLRNVAEGPLSTLCYGCKNMRSLTLLGSKITTISSGSIMQMKCLRTLNLSGNRLDNVPNEIGELIHLRYMNLSGSDNLKELPDAVCDLYNLQTLVLIFCTGLRKLPKAMGKLINLKHLYVAWCEGLRYLPKGIGSLKSLQVLDCFYVCEGDDDEALKLGDLRIMDQLQGGLSIRNLGKDDASEIEKAQLGNKEHLSHLLVDFLGGREQRRGDEEIVKALQPHQNLESLSILWCHGTTESLCWIKSLHNLRKLRLHNWRFCEFLPPLGKLPSLEILEIGGMWNVKKVGVEFVGIEEEEVSGILFPKLKQLSFYSMYEWEEWAFLSEITIMPRLSFLQIVHCPKLKALPDFLYKITALRTLEIKRSPILEGEYEKDVGKEWHNISHIPNLTILPYN